MGRGPEYTEETFGGRDLCGFKQRSQPPFTLAYKRCSGGVSKLYGTDSSLFDLNLRLVTVFGHKSNCSLLEGHSHANES